MEIPEKLGGEEKPEQRGLFERFREGVTSTVRKAVRTLFPREDPRVREILTPDFLDEFREGHARMCRERRDSIMGDPQASFWDGAYANGFDIQYRIFEGMLAQYPQMRALPVHLQREIRLRLLRICGLLPGEV